MDCGGLTVMVEGEPVEIVLKKTGDIKEDKHVFGRGDKYKRG